MRVYEYSSRRNPRRSPPNVASRKKTIWRLSSVAQDSSCGEYVGKELIVFIVSIS